MGRVSHRSGAVRVLLLAAAAAVVLLCFFTALSNLDRGREEEGRRQLEQALRRACVACYAVEGVYPPTFPTWRSTMGFRWMRRATPSFTTFSLQT